MTSKVVKYIALLIALSVPLSSGAYAWGSQFNDLRSCEQGTHSQSFPNGNGYRCVPNDE